MSVSYPIIVMQVGDEQLVFTGAEIKNATLVEEVHPAALELPISTLEFDIISYDDSFSMFGGEYFDLLSERLPLQAWEVVDGVYIPLGKFYLSDWENISEHEFSFKAIDAIGVLDSTTFDGLFIEDGTAVATVVADLLDPLEVDYYVSDEFEDTIKGWIPPSTYREALQQICFAAGGIASTSRSDKLNILPVNLPSDWIDDIELTEYSEVTDSDKIRQKVKLLPVTTSISLTIREYTKNAAAENIYVKSLGIGNHKLVFKFPFTDFTFSFTAFDDAALATETPDYITTENGDYIQVTDQWNLYLNGLYFSLLSAGLVTITGKKWTDQAVVIPFTEEGAFEFKDKQDISLDISMINADNSQAPLDRARDYYRHRYSQDMELLPSEVKPGDMVLTSSLYEKEIFAVVTKMDTNLSGGFLSKASVLGAEYVAPT